jgi:hypothetical protein
MENNQSLPEFVWVVSFIGNYHNSTPINAVYLSKDKAEKIYKEWLEKAGEFSRVSIEKSFLFTL